MTISPASFVEALATHCRDAAVSDCVSTYSRPPGRRPAQRLVRLSQWFNGLSPGDREMVVEAMNDVAHSTLFGVLCAFDGARTIDDEGHRFVVMAELNGDSRSLSSASINLHDLLEEPEGSRLDGA